MSQTFTLSSVIGWAGSTPNGEVFGSVEEVYARVENHNIVEDHQQTQLLFVHSS